MSPSKGYYSSLRRLLFFTLVRERRCLNLRTFDIAIQMLLSIKAANCTERGAIDYWEEVMEFLVTVRLSPAYVDMSRLYTLVID